MKRVLFTTNGNDRFSAIVMLIYMPSTASTLFLASFFNLSTKEMCKLSAETLTIEDQV
jgi:hypothetical protein